MMRKSYSTLVLLLAALTAACSQDSPVALEAEAVSVTGAVASRAGASDHRSKDVNRQLAALRRATVQYHDPAAAEAAGYIPEDACISASTVGAPPELGAMGFHFVNPGLIDDVFDPLQPEALVYEERGDGTLHLVAVEYLFAGENPPPFAGEIHFHEFGPPFADFALHAWVWLGNPNGMFADFNPNVACPSE